MTSVRAGVTARRGSVEILAVVVLLVGIAAGAGFSLLGRPAFLDTVALPWWGICLATVVSDSCVLHLRGRRDSAVEAAITYLPLVLGLFFTSPTQLLVGRSLAEAVVLARRRPSAIKWAFNLALVAAEAAVAGAVFRAMRPAPHLDPSTWLAALLATLVAFFLGAAAVESVVLLHQDRTVQWRGAVVRWRHSVELRAGQVFRVVVVVAVALLAATALDAAANSWWLALACGALLAWGYRRYAVLHDRYLDLERLRSVGLQGEPDAGPDLGGVLASTRELLFCERAELVVVDGIGAAHLRLGPDGVLRREVLAAGSAMERLLRRMSDVPDPLLLGRGSRDPDVRSWLDAEKAREAAAIPLRGVDGTIGVLLAADRRRDRATAAFLSHDVLLLEALAEHACSALRVGEVIGRLQQEALHDSLTGLPNRVHMQRRLAGAVAAIRPDAEASVAVMILDLNGFKQVNDSLGHDRGDLLLTRLGARLAALADEHTVIARLGGDEFAILAEGRADAQEAVQLAEKVIAAVSTPVDLAGDVVSVGAAVGVALATSSAVACADLLRGADLAMYDAKTSGGGVRVFDPRSACDRIS